jgi:hypothetical protein
MATPFLDYLDIDPALAYYSSPAGLSYMAGMTPAAYQAIPMDARATQAPASQTRRRVYENQYQNVYNDYLGALGTQIRGGVAPTLRFADYLEQNPFTERYAALTPQQAGRSVSRFSPSMRQIYF